MTAQGLDRQTRAQDVGPDLVIAGAARSGTSWLASYLGEHPRIDPGAIKEPNYFSREQGRGVQWYDSLYRPRRPDLIRLDASASYTYPQHLDALARLATAAPKVFVVYVVRDPLPRLVSHYLFYRHYFKARYATEDFPTALRNRPVYAGASDYGIWLKQLSSHFPPEQWLVVPFEALSQSTEEVARLICRCCRLPAPPAAHARARRHRNDTVEFRHQLAARAARALRHSSAYPHIRGSLGADRLRQIRGWLTRKPVLPSVEEILASAEPDQRRELQALESRARTAVRAYLEEQDARYDLGWATLWKC